MRSTALYPLSRSTSRGKWQGGLCERLWLKNAPMSTWGTLDWRSTPFNQLYRDPSFLIPVITSDIGIPLLFCGCTACGSPTRCTELLIAGWASSLCVHRLYFPATLCRSFWYCYYPFCSCSCAKWDFRVRDVNIPAEGMGLDWSFYYASPPLSSIVTHYIQP